MMIMTKLILLMLINFVISCDNVDYISDLYNNSNNSYSTNSNNNSNNNNDYI